MALIGYARVSTEGQDLAPQRAALAAAGCTEIVEETASGADRARPELARLLGRLRRGDVLVVVRLDRLARSLAHLLAVLERLQQAGAHLRSLSDPVDTASPSGRLVVQVIGAIAEFERSLIAERTRAGLAVARYLRGHRREAAERGVAPQDYRPPTLAQVARHLAEDARISSPGGGGAWAPSSVKAPGRSRAQGASWRIPEHNGGVELILGPRGNERGATQCQSVPAGVGGRDTRAGADGQGGPERLGRGELGRDWGALGGVPDERKERAK